MVLVAHTYVINITPKQGVRLIFFDVFKKYVGGATICFPTVGVEERPNVT